jgi:pimeloyl-ACP methyl ester carboxylesterase
MKETKVTILNEYNEKLVGLEAGPSIGTEKYPAIILVPGFGVTKEEYGLFDSLAESLSKEGFLVYRFDFSGCGESEGDYSETSLSKLKSDLSNIIEFVKSQLKADSSKIGILGQSFGSSVVVAIEPKVKCLVLTGSIAHPKEVLSRLFGSGYNPDGISTRIKSNGRVTKMKPGFWKDFENYRLLDSIKQIHCPILFINGGEDGSVPVSEAEEYFAKANPPKQKILIDGANHNFRNRQDEVGKVVLNWFKKYLG